MRRRQSDDDDDGEIYRAEGTFGCVHVHSERIGAQTFLVVVMSR